MSIFKLKFSPKVKLTKLFKIIILVLTFLNEVPSKPPETTIKTVLVWFLLFCFDLFQRDRKFLVDVQS